MSIHLAQRSMGSRRVTQWPSLPLGGTQSYMVLSDGQIASGLMLASWNAHYRSVTSLTFSGDSSFLVTASADASVHIFLVSQLVDAESSSSPYSKPYGSLSDHTLAITAVALGKTAGSTGGRCWTASEDGTIKVSFHTR